MKSIPVIIGVVFLAGCLHQVDSNDIAIAARKCKGYANIHKLAEPVDSAGLPTIICKETHPE